MAVYFIQAGDSSGAVKIGFAVDVYMRLRDLQVGNHLPLVLLREVEGAKFEERWFHRHFKPQHLRGEWYRFHALMMTLDAPAATERVDPLAGIPGQSAFLDHISQFLRITGMSATDFGKKAISDPTFVFELRDGRSPSLRTVEKVKKFITDFDPKKVRASASDGAAA